MAHSLKTVLRPYYFSFLLLELAYFKAMPFKSQAKPNKRWQDSLEAMLSQQGGTVPFNSPLLSTTYETLDTSAKDIVPTLEVHRRGRCPFGHSWTVCKYGLPSVTSAPSNVWYDLLASGLNMIWMFLDIIFNLRKISWTCMISVESDTWDLPLVCHLLSSFTTWWDWGRSMLDSQQLGPQGRGTHGTSRSRELQ